MLSDSRMNLAGITPHNVGYVARAIAETSPRGLG
jgi:aspartate/tyrosine/aromatic aminotransferase